MRSRGTLSERREPSFLAELPEDLRARVQARSVQRDLSPGEVLAIEGEPCPGLCIVEVGVIKIYKSGLGGREQVLLLARPGDSFADAAAFTGGPMPASAAAIERSRVGIVAPATLDALIDEDSRFARAVIRHLSLQLRHVVGLVEDLSFRHIQERVAKILLQGIRPRRGVGAGVGGRALTQREIAELAGTAREVVSRALGALEQRGLIRVDRGQIELLDPAGLEALLDD